MLVLVDEIGELFVVGRLAERIRILNFFGLEG